MRTSPAAAPLAGAGALGDPVSGEPALKRLVVQAAQYGLTNILTMLAGLVSFPLLTRVFSVGDYGLMNLIAATLTVVVALGKIGIQHSILRYHSEVTAGKSRYSVEQLVSTTFFGMLATGLVAMALLVLGVQLLPSSWLHETRLRTLFAIASPFVVIQVMESPLVNFVRAEQRVGAYMRYQVAKKYLTLGLMVCTLLLISRTLPAFYASGVVAESLALGGLAVVSFRRSVRPSPGQFSRPLYLELLAFGVPMMIGYEMSGIVLAVGDRYVIEGLIGEEPLGLYSAAYNLCQYVQAAFIASVGDAIMPIYMRMWDREGREATAAFISRSLARYLMFGAPMVAGLAAVGPELLPTLASAKYASGEVVLPWVIAGMLFSGSTGMVGAGLFIHRRTRVIMSIVMSGAILNLVLNLVMVRPLGIVGAAIATLISYIYTALAFTAAGRRYLAVDLPWKTLLRAGCASLAMFFLVRPIYPGHHFLTVGLRAAAGALAYVAMMYAIDASARELVNQVLARLRLRRA